MRARFKWHWDEELGGEALESGAVPARSRRLLWAALLLIAAVAALFYWQQARRLQRQEDAVREDISASYRLWYNAVATGDTELFQFQLSNQDAVWQDGQRDLLLQARLLQRPELGLQPLPGNPLPTIVEVTLAPDWQSGTLLADYAYHSVDPADDAPTVYLRRAHFFRRHDERWLLSPGDDEFWGPRQRLQTEGLTVFYPARDAEVVERIGRELWDELQQLCGAITSAVACRDALQVTIRFEIDERLLASWRDDFTPIFDGGDYVLPAPTLVGVPQGEDSYRRLYAGYTRRILETTRQNLSPPLPLPQQAIQVLCFPADGRTLRLFRYDPQNDLWTAELTDRAFRYLMPGPRGDGVILQAFTRGEEVGRLRLFWWRDGQEQLLYDREMPDQTARPAGWSIAARPRLLLQAFSSAGTSAQHRWLDLDDCDATGCAVVDLPGYTVWSPDGSQTLVSKEQFLWRGDSLGTPLVQLGSALSSFWLDDETYGYVRYDREAGAESMQIAISTAGEDLPQIVMPVAGLAQLIDANKPPLLFINHVAVNPADNDLLLISATTVGSSTAKYNIFSLRLSTRQAQLLQQFERLPTGYPSLLTPAGYPPFRLSPDGRWLLVTLLASPSPTTWSFQLYDLHRQQSLELSAFYPEYPAQFPFYDWSADGQWLAIVDDGFLRLIAPAHNYQKLVTHRQDNCLHAAWVS